MAEPGPSRSTDGRATIDIVHHADIWDGLDASEALLMRAATAAFAAAAPAGSAPCEITLVLTDDSEMRELNAVWRGKDSSTNVLSFPAGAHPDIGTGEPVPLGDIVLAAETVRAEAEEQGIALADHLTHLVVHGVLHLLGHDHESDDEAEAMESLETAILASLGVADPYARQGARVELAR